MICLAFDSTAKAASVAVTRDDTLLALYTVDNGLTQSELLLPMAEDVLRSLKLGFDDIDLYAVSVGPGSFTGVRIGVALVKGLAFGKGKPCVAVSTVEALADNLLGLRGVYAPCMDARRGQVYTAIFENRGGELVRLTEDMAISLTELGERLSAYEAPIYLSGDGYSSARGALLGMGLTIEATPELLLRENAYSVARVAIRKYKAGECVSDGELTPTYLRLPQAERERLERLKVEEG